MKRRISNELRSSNTLHAAVWAYNLFTQFKTNERDTTENENNEKREKNIHKITKREKKCKQK